MILGLRTVIYPVMDLAQAQTWYETVFKTKAYFVESFYVGFSIGGFELGLVPDGKPNTEGAQVFWGVDNIESELSRLLELGAILLEPITDVGEGTKVASVKDPFGNQLAIIENPHFDLTQVR